MPEPLTETLVVVGVGLIGGSVGMAARTFGAARRVIGIGRDPLRMQLAVELGAIDEFTADLAAGAARADGIVICTPVSRIVTDVLACASAAPRNAWIMDAGSTKGGIVAALRDAPAAQTLALSERFLGAHPLAGSEQQGVAHANARLFQDRVCILTPTPQTPQHLLERCRAFWSALGARIVDLDPDDHDKALAATSHLPHVIAAAVARTVPEDALVLAAGAYRDVTRVAMADAQLWNDIFLANRPALLHTLDAFTRELDAFRSALAQDPPDTAALLAWWESAKRQRASFSWREPRPSPES